MQSVCDTAGVLSSYESRRFVGNAACRLQQCLTLEWSWTDTDSW